MLGMLGLSSTHTAYPVIVLTKKFWYTLSIDTFARSNLFDAARGGTHKRSARRYHADKPPDMRAGLM